MEQALPRLGVVIVSFNSSEIIADCLASLFASTAIDLSVVVVDNASTDESCEAVRAFARAPSSLREIAPIGQIKTQSPDIFFDDDPAAIITARKSLALICSKTNGGYADGVNVGISVLARDPGIDLFWILNPDCVVPEDTARIFAAAGADDNFSIMGGRILFQGSPLIIQTDGGRVSRRTARCHSVNAGAIAEHTLPPSAASLDYISGASMIASRRFIEMAGMMETGYFLYYEEVDWAFRKGTLPLRVTAQAITFHRGGTTIGSGGIGRRPSSFANFFNYRSRMMFARRFLHTSMFPTRMFALAKAAQLAGLGAFDEAEAIIRAVLGCAAPRHVRDRLRKSAMLERLP